MTIYLLTSFLFLFLAILGALDAAVVSYELMPWFNGLRWLRVHLITLGIMTEALFGILPTMVAMYQGQPKPRTRFDIWLLLNGGILLLLVGIPLVNYPVIVAGGILILAATLALMHQLWRLRREDGGKTAVSPTRKFYLAGLAYFFAGYLCGDGTLVRLAPGARHANPD